jgi:hypothetical protein
VLAHVTSRLAANDVSVAQLMQHLEEGRASLDLVLHDASLGQVRAALAEIATFPEVIERPFYAPVIRA